MSDIERTSRAFALYSAEDAQLSEAHIFELVRSGVDVHEVTSNRKTLLHYAAFYGHKRTVQWLLDHGANIEARDCNGETLLHYAAWRGHTETVKYLVERGANIEARNGEGETLLHLAASKGNTKMVKLLLAQGANIWAKDNEEKIAIDDKKTDLLKPHSDRWGEKLKAVKAGNCDEINTTQDLYYLASVMQPSNPKNVPPPKEYIRTLFKQYIPHKTEFDVLYAAIFAAPRPPELDLHTARKEARDREVAL